MVNCFLCCPGITLCITLKGITEKVIHAVEGSTVFVPGDNLFILMIAKCFRLP